MTRATSDTPDYVTLPAWVDLAIVDDDSVPGPPTSLEATAAGPTAIDLSWAAPSDPGSSPLRGYQIEWSVDGDTVAVRFGVADWVFVDAEDHYSAVKDVLLSIVDDSLDEEAETLGLLTEMTPGMGAAETVLTLPTVDDLLDEPDRAVAVTLIDHDGYVLVGDATPSWYRAALLANLRW